MALSKRLVRVGVSVCSVEAAAVEELAVVVSREADTKDPSDVVPEESLLRTRVR